jgi:L,D-transpeptidase catalytic domain
MRRTEQRGANKKNLRGRVMMAALAIVALFPFVVPQPAAGQDSAPADHALSVSEPALVRELIISIQDRKLAVIENGEVVKIYPVAVGANGTPTPAGQFRVVNRIVSPTYYHKGEVIGPGPSNPLGNRWMGLDRKGYGIHGTNVPSSIGEAASHGCIRMRKHDVEELFRRVTLGDVVEIHRQRTPELAQIFGSEAQPRTGTVGKVKSVPAQLVVAAMAGAL